MTTKTKKANGRPRRPYIDSHGNHINGLRRRPHDGRWVIVATGEMFSEPDEAMAIARFHRMTSNGRIVVSATLAEIGTAAATTLPTRAADFANAVEAATQQANRTGSALRFDPSRPPAEWTQELDAHEPLLWAWFAQQIRTRAQYVAQQTGIAQLGYLTDLKAPEKLPSLDSLETLWTEKADVLDEERRKVLAAWKTFRKWTCIELLTDITPQVVLQYRQQVYEQYKNGKSQQHLFNRARRLLSFARSQAEAMEHCTKALEAMRLLTPNDTTVALDPRPVDPEDFRKLVSKAKGKDRAIVLLMLNAALHQQEALDLTWDNIKGDYVIARRKKKGSFLRIAVLWPETKAALAALPRLGERIFYSNQTKAPLGIKGAEARFRRLREKAKVPHVQADQIRDGAATAAAGANCNDAIINLLLGHRNPGMRDHYALRRPELVRPACDAVYAHYGPF